jgi:hypothetical protein
MTDRCCVPLAFDHHPHQRLKESSQFISLSRLGPDRLNAKILARAFRSEVDLMAIQFFGGPYDGRKADLAAINQYASILPVSGDLGNRVFVLMPPPTSWDELIRGASAQAGPVYPYERVMTPEGPRFEWQSGSGLDRALLAAKLKVHPRAQTALSTLSNEARQAIVDVVVELQKVQPEKWPAQSVVRVTPDKPVYLVRLAGMLSAFVRILENGELELFDIVREDTLHQFVQRYGKVGAPG